jgi:RNA 3'-terminal phosphate cyclase (ATP)
MAGTVQIDGSYGEGGGQILRTSCSLAALTGKTVEIRNIRAKRSRPGLQPQHLAAVRAAASLCEARLTGDAVGSRELVFEPQRLPKPDRYEFDIRTAGAAGLVCQTVLIPLAHAEGGSQVRAIGGTHVPHSPPVEYLEQVYLPVLARAGLAAQLTYPRAGFFPKGNGQIELAIRPTGAPRPFDLSERGRLTTLRATILTANLPDHVAERGAATVERFLKGVGRDVEIEKRTRPALDAGAAVLLVAECEGGLAGFSGLGERGKPMEKVAEAPCEEFMRWWKTGAAVDEHLADQLVLPAILASGESCWTTPVVSEHLRTVIWLVDQFVPAACRLDEREDGTATVTLRPAG